MELIRKYFDLNQDKSLFRIDETTFTDLNFNEIYDAIDYTDSSIGQQYLYHLLRTIPRAGKIKPHEEWLSRYSEDAKLQQKISQCFKKINDSDSYLIYPLITKDYQPYTKMKVRLLRVLQFVPTLFLGLFLLTQSGWFLLGTFASFIVNLIIHLMSKNISFLYSGSVPRLYNMLLSAERLKAISLNQDIDPDITGSLEETNALKKKAGSFRFFVKMESDLAAFVWAIAEMVKVFFLTEPINLNSLFNSIKEKKEPLRRIYEYVGLIDSLQAIARFRKEIPYYCLPCFTEKERALETDGIYHPLIKDCVPNSFTSKNDSFLIMGSNMSGKTTFIRTVGVNVILAQTIHTCLAHSFTLMPLHPFSAISLNDNLLEGQSYYLREVLRIKEVVEQTKEGANIILLDELFKGTNTIERIAGAKAVLSYLASNHENIILAATHDIELTALLDKEYTPVYFTENIQGGKLTFDYKLTYQHNTQKNAIKILELYDFPPSLVEDALHTANHFPPTIQSSPDMKGKQDNSN